MPAYCLSIHASYRCQQSGACCTAGWSIPIEPDKVSVLRTRGLLNGALRGSPDARRGDSQVIVARTADGACVFYDAEHDRLCAVQRDAGVGLMPTACRNFPRVALCDPRGTFITLSHFCPTAARLLLSTGPIEIVEAPGSISLDGEVEGLDATTVMPPLLRANMLMDWDGYSAWEREGVAVLSDEGYSARVALAIISEATRDASQWSPGRETLAVCVSTAYERARSSHAGDERPASIPLQRALKGFLASHLFANWAAYRGGLGAAFESLELAFSLVGEDHTKEEGFIAAVRRADLQLRHSHVRPRSLPALRRH